MQTYNIYLFSGTCNSLFPYAPIYLMLSLMALHKKTTKAGKSNQ